MKNLPRYVFNSSLAHVDTDVVVTINSCNGSITIEMNAALKFSKSEQQKINIGYL